MSGTTEIVSETPNLELMQRADVPAVWETFREKLTKLKATAETLTVTDVTQLAEMKLARATRLTLKNLRLEIETKRKELGEEALRRKQKIDLDARCLKELIEPLEVRLLEQENFIEFETARIERVKRDDRTKELTPYLSGPPAVDLGKMSGADYSALLNDSKAAHVARLERERKEKEAGEAAAKAERERIEAQRVENERLKKEAKEREAEIKKEREAATAERKAAEEIARKEREAREKIEAEVEKKKAEEAKAESERIIAEKKAASAPDKRKIEQFASDVRGLSAPTLQNTTVGDLIVSQVSRFAAWIEKQGESL